VSAANGAESLRRPNVAATLVLTLLFVASAAASNWAIQHVGRNNGPIAPRTIPIGWGMQAASGVVLVGVMISVRDALHEQVGIRGTLVAITIGSGFSALLAPPALAIASGTTMLVAESADALVYQRLRTWGWFLAATGSNLASALLDSAIFLVIAYGANVAAHGTYALTVGKVEVSLFTLAALALASRVWPRRLGKAT
jgi:uncharacterized PurR-regulated membrane protein YhhQ (DUF165 family)